MAKVCEICGKGVQHGRNVSHAHNVTLRRWDVNLRTVRAVVSGKPKRVRVCTRCLRSGRIEKRMPQGEARKAKEARQAL
jgi:large subunit ribosomal protein L28